MITQTQRSYARYNHPYKKYFVFFKLVLQSFKGDEMDYTQGSIRRAVILLAIPMMLEMIMESVFALVVPISKAILTA